MTDSLANLTAPRDAQKDIPSSFDDAIPVTGEIKSLVSDDVVDDELGNEAPIVHGKPGKMPLEGSGFGDVVGVVGTGLAAVGKSAAGVGETMISGTTSLGAGLIGGAEGAYQSTVGPDKWYREYKRAFEKNLDRFTYVPRTEYGKAILGWISDVVDSGRQEYHKIAVDPLRGSDGEPSVLGALSAGAFEGLLVGLPMFAGVKVRGKHKAQKTDADAPKLDSPTIEGEYIQGQGPRAPGDGGTGRQGRTVDPTKPEQLDMPVSEGGVIPGERVGKAVATDDYYGGRTVESQKKIADRPFPDTENPKIQSPQGKLPGPNPETLKHQKDPLSPVDEVVPLPPHEMSLSSLKKAIESGGVMPWETTLEQNLKTLPNPNRLIQEIVIQTHRGLVELALQDSKVHVPGPVAKEFRNFDPRRVSVTGLQSKQGGYFRPDVFILDTLKVLSKAVPAAVKTSKNMHGMASAIARPVFFKPVQNIRNYGTPTAQKLANMFLAESSSSIPIAADFVQSVSKRQGEFMTRFDSIVDPLRGRFTVNRPFEASVLEAVRGSRNVSAQVRKISSEIRSLLDDFVMYLHSSGLDVGYIKDYFPRIYDTNKIIKNPESFEAFLVNQGFSPESASSFRGMLVREDGVPYFPVDRSLGLSSHAGRYPGKGPAKNPHTDYSRHVQIPDNVLSPWLVNDIQAVLSKYIDQGVKRAEMARRFGPHEEHLNSMMGQILYESQSMGKPLTQERLTADVYGLVDAFLGRLGRIENPWVNKTNNAVSGAMTMIHLPLVSLASLVEFAAPIVQFKMSPRAYLRGLQYAANTTLRNFDKKLTGKHHFPKVETELMLQRLGLITHQALQSSVANRMVGTTGRLTDKFIRATGLEFVTNVQRIIASETVTDFVKVRSKYLEANPTSNKAAIYRQELAELGLQADEAALWYRGGMRDTVFKNKLEDAIIRGVKLAITDPNPASIPLWMSKPAWRWVGLFQRFYTAMSNMFYKKALKDLVGKKTLGRKANLAVGMVNMTILGYFSIYLADMIRGNKRKNDEPLWKNITDSLDRAGFFGHGTRAYALARPYKYGRGDTMAARVVSMGGPVLGDATRVGQAFFTNNPRKSLALRAAKLTPVANVLPGTRKWIEDVYKDVLGANPW